MDVAQLLLNDVRAPQPDRVQVMLPKLDAAAGLAKMCHQPFPSALLRILFHGLYHGLGRELLVVS